MKSFLFTAALVLGGIWLWSKFAKGAPKAAVKPRADYTSPVDTGVFYGPYADPMTGAYLPSGTTVGAVAFQTQPVGLA